MGPVLGALGGVVGLVVSGLQLLDDGVIRVAPLFKSADSVEDSFPRLVVVVTLAIAHNGVALSPQVGYDDTDGGAACAEGGFDLPALNWVVGAAVAHGS